MQCTTVLSYQKVISQSSSLHHVVVHSTQSNNTVCIHGTTIMPNVHLCYSHQASLSSWHLPTVLFKTHWLTHWQTLCLYTTIKKFITFATPTFWAVPYITWPLWKLIYLECVLTGLILNTRIFKYRICYIQIYYFVSHIPPFLGFQPLTDLLQNKG